MGKRNSSILVKKEALKIANKLLEVFEAFNNDEQTYLMMTYPTDDLKINKEMEQRKWYVTFEWSDRCPGKLKIKKHIINSEGDLYKNNTYELYYKGKKYIMNLYDSLEAYGSYFSFKPYYRDRYIFCNIKLVNIDDIPVKEMEFTFDISDMKMIELFGVERIVSKEYFNICTGEIIWKPIIIKKSRTNLIEKNLEGRTLGKIRKLN